MRGFCFKRASGWGCLLFSSLFSSCISTRYQGMNTCPAALGPADKVLVPYLRPIPLARSATYFQALKEQFDAHQVPVRYAPEEEWALKAAGISNPLDSAQYPALRRQGYTHLLLIERVAQQEAAGGWSAYTPWEVSQRNLPNQPVLPLDEMNHQATLVFQLLSLQPRTVLFTGTVKTTVSPLASPDDDGGETYVNLGSVELATRKALKKGVQRLFDKCQ